MSLPQYLYDPDNYTLVVGHFNINGAIPNDAASRLYLSSGGGVVVPATYPGLVTAHNCYWSEVFHAWVADDATLPATILISGFNGAYSTLWIDPSTTFFGWNDTMWQSFPPTGAQLISMPAAGDFHTSNNYNWTFPRFVIKDIPLHSFAQVATLSSFKSFAAYPSSGNLPITDGVTLGDVFIGIWPIEIPHDSFMLSIEAMLSYGGGAPVAGVTEVRVVTRGLVGVGTDRSWSPVVVGTEESTPDYLNVVTTNPQVVSVPVNIFVNNSENDYYLRIQHEYTPVNLLFVTGLRISYIETGLRGL